MRLYSRRRRSQGLDLAAVVGLAVRAHPVRLLGPSALWAAVHARRLDPMRGAPLVPARLGGFFLGDGHWRRSIASACLAALPRLYRDLPLSSLPLARPGAGATTQATA